MAIFSIGFSAAHPFWANIFFYPELDSQNFGGPCDYYYLPYPHFGSSDFGFSRFFYFFFNYPEPRRVRDLVIFGSLPTRHRRKEGFNSWGCESQVLKVKIGWVTTKTARRHFQISRYFWCYCRELSDYLCWYSAYIRVCAQIWRKNILTKLLTAHPDTDTD